MLNHHQLFKYLPAFLPFTSLVTLSAEMKPNIILFLVDDMGWQDTSLPFYDQKTDLNNQFYTPNMERLASQGVKFTQAYACSVSTPTRVSLLTGMNAASHRVTNWTMNKDVPTDAKDDVVAPPRWNVNGISQMPGDSNATYVTTLPSILKKNGYATIMCGKAHFGARNTPGSNPLNLGFDVNIGGHAAGQPGSYLGESNYGNKFQDFTPPFGVPGLTKYHGKDVFLTDALTREAIHSMDSISHADKPFFLYMAHYAVHIPFNPDNRFYDKYVEKGLDKTEAMYAALIEGMDKSLGDIMDYLEKNNLSDNTIILFMSDNGGLSLHARGGLPNTHNLPLRSGKGSAYEGGIREPMIVKWNGVAKQNTTIHQYVKIEDFFPSILQMAGIKHAKTAQKIDGVSFIPLLKNESKSFENRAIYWHYPNNWVPVTKHREAGIGAYSAVRQGDYKLIYFHKNREIELYNLKNDIGEQNNLAKSHPEITYKLAKKLTNYLRKSNAQMPVDKTTGKSIEMPDVFVKNPNPNRKVE